MKHIYLDYASTTPMDSRVLKAMLPFFSGNFENPSSIYSGGIEAKEAIDFSRAKIAKFLTCSPDEIIFTSGGTESDNLAIIGILKKFKKGHVISSIIEHPAVYEACKRLETEGFKVTYLKPDKDGIISANQIKRALRKDTILVSIMYANNEIGTIQPIKEISKVICKWKMENKYPLFHTDACQATLYLPMDVKELGVDLLSFNGSKIYGPKGIGVLFKKSNIEIEPQIVGGQQENGYRAGTENVPSIVGLAKAVEIISTKKAQNEKLLRDYLISKLIKIEGITINGSTKRRLPNNVNFSIKGIEGESVLLDLNHQFVAVSTGSACSSRDLKPSRVITAISGEVAAHGSIRVTIGRSTQKSEIDIFLKVLKKTINRFRQMSPYGRS